jgi:lipopolysaccharide export system permease protein
MVTSIDRYIWRRELYAFGGVLVLVTAILSLENLPRICAAVSHTSAPIRLLGQMLMALLPEYLAVGMLVASFIAPAWTIRMLAARGEWQTLPACGLSPLRIMLVPLLIAALATGAQSTLRLVLEPSGERLLDAVGADLDRGDFGLPLTLGEFVKVDSDTTVLLMPSASADRSFGHAFLHHGRSIYTAQSANVRRAASGRIEIDLFDGTELDDDGKPDHRVLRFAELRFCFTPSVNRGLHLPSVDGLKRLPLASLIDGVRRETGGAVDQPRPMTSALLARIGNALFCLLLPWFAYALAVPPRRGRGGAGFALGVAALVLFLRTSSLVEANFTHWPVSAVIIHITLWSAATLARVRFSMAHDEGAIDLAFNAVGAWLVRRGHRLRILLPGQATRRGPRTASA